MFSDNHKKYINATLICRQNARFAMLKQVFQAVPLFSAG